MPTFGADPSHFVVVPDDDNPGQTKAPDAGFVVKVRNAVTLAALDDLVTEDFGEFTAYTTPADVHRIQLSTDGGSNWKKKLTSEELIDGLAVDMPNIDTFLGDASAAADAAVAAAASAAATLAAAQAITQGKSTYQIYLDEYAAAHAGSVVGALDQPDWLAAQAGEDGDDSTVAGPTGLTPVRVHFPLGVQEGELSDPYTLDYPATMLPKLSMGLESPNNTATPYQLTLIQDGTIDVLNQLGKVLSIPNGQSRATQTLDDPIAFPVNTKLEWQVYDKGADGSGTTTVPVLRAYTAYASGVGGKPITLNSGLGFTDTVALPTGWQVADELEMTISSTLQPTVTSSSGTWVQVGSVLSDSNNFVFATTWRKTAVTGEVNPSVTFSANAGMAAVLGAYYTVDGANPLDLASTAVVSSVASSASVASPGGTTAVANELGVAAFALRFAASAATSAVSVADTNWTKVAEALTSRGTSPNYQVSVFTRSYATVGSTMSAVAATTTANALWLNRGRTLRPGVASSPGTRPWVDFYLVYDYS